MGFPRQECWNGLLFPSPGDLPDPNIEPVSPAWQVDSLPLSLLWNSLAHIAAAAAAAAKSLQPCPTLCDPIDHSPPGSPVPGILQARTLEWVAISFSNAWKWKVKVKSLSHVRLQHIRLLHPWDFPGKSTGVGCHLTYYLWTKMCLTQIKPTRFSFLEIWILSKVLQECYEDVQMASSLLSWHLDVLTLKSFSRSCAIRSPKLPCCFSIPRTGLSLELVLESHSPTAFNKFISFVSDITQSRSVAWTQACLIGIIGNVLL